MKREIEFRGKTAKGKWVYGSFLQLEYLKTYTYIVDRYGTIEVDNIEGMEEVIPETVGQYVGIKDKNGKKVYEGDIVWGDTIEGDWHKGVVEYNEDVGCFYVNAKNFMQYEKNSDSWSMLGCWTVEGNIFDKERDNGRKETH